MARFEFKLPDIGEGVVEGEIVKWLVSAGDQVEADQPLLEVMTDKATVTISAPKAGSILETCGEEGKMAKVHDVLVVFDVAGDEVQETPAPVSSPAPPAAVPAPKVSHVGATAAGPAMAPAAPVGGGRVSQRVLATPATRRKARELGIDLKQVQGTGTAGRVTSQDVQMFAAASGGASPGAAGGAAVAQPTVVPQSAALEERIPVRGLRRMIAQKMRTSEDHVVPFTFVEECDVTSLVELRSRINENQAQSGSSLKVTYLPFVLKAIIASLKKFPKLNSVYDENAGELVIKRYYNLGIGVATDAGLSVVVLKNVDRKSIGDLGTEMLALSDRARQGKSTPDDVSGSTFTVTSLGLQGGMLATPIINYPEVAILGIHKIKETPVVRSGEIVIRQIMNISCSFDHRIVDGHEGAAFTYEVIKYLEDPNLLFMEMV